MKAFTILRYGRFMASIALVALAFASCADDGVSFDASTEGPKAGTSLMTIFYRDSAGILVTRPFDTATIRVIPQVPIYAGRAGVLPMLMRGDTSFMHYGTNGDIGLYEPELSGNMPGFGRMEMPESWIVYPFGSKIAIRQTLLDSTRYLANGDTLNLKVTSVQQFLGPEMVPTTTGQLNTMKASSVRTVMLSDGDKQWGESLYLTMWYSPKLGSFVQADSVKATDAGNGKGFVQTAHTRWVTRSYNLIK